MIDNMLYNDYFCILAFERIQRIIQYSNFNSQTMTHDFTVDNISEIAEIFGVEAKKTGSVYRFSLNQNDTKIALEIHMGLEIDGKKTNIVSVYSQNVFLQLHNCTGIVTSNTLQQVTFFGKIGGQTTGLIVEKSGAVNMYANVDENLLSGDFTKLPPEIMMCSVALSLTESLDFEGFTFDEES